MAPDLLAEDVCTMGNMDAVTHLLRSALLPLKLQVECFVNEFGSSPTLMPIDTARSRESNCVYAQSK